MRKVILVVLALTMAASAESYVGKLGMDFTAGGSTLVGIRYHFTDMYCLNPDVGFRIGSGNDYFALSIGNLIYIGPVNDIDPYIDITATIVAPEQGDTQLSIGASFGAQYAVNATISLFGQAGLLLDLNDDDIQTFESAIGCVFYFD
jgi:hypothetical protein